MVQFILKNNWRKYMKTYKELKISGFKKNIDTFAATICNYSNDEWAIKLDSNDMIQLEYLGNDDKEICGALVFLTKEDRQIEILNISSAHKIILSLSQYNYLLEECASKCLIPCAGQCKLDYTITSGDIVLYDFMSKESSEKLEAFVGTSNKLTGSAHSSDQRMWFFFILSAYKNKDSRAASYLKQWLIEECNYSEGIAGRLLSEFQYSMDLFEFLGISKHNVKSKLN